jgi:hypothetical protein
LGSEASSNDRIEMVINVKAAKALDLSVAPTLLAGAYGGGLAFLLPNWSSTLVTSRIDEVVS